MPKENLPNSTDKKNITWQTNQILIRDAFLEVLKTEKRAPQITEISKRTKLSYKTVTKHIKELDFKSVTDKAKVLTDDVMMSIFRSASKGNSGSQKLWMQIAEGWTEKKEFDIPGGLKITFVDDV